MAVNNPIGLVDIMAIREALMQTRILLNFVFYFTISKTASAKIIVYTMTPNR